MPRHQRHRNARVHRRNRTVPPPMSGVQEVSDDDIIDVIELSRPAVDAIRIGVDAAC
jgi:hypothetical protein